MYFCSSQSFLFLWAIEKLYAVLITSLWVLPSAGLVLRGEVCLHLVRFREVSCLAVVWEGLIWFGLQCIAEGNQTLVRFDASVNSACLTWAEVDKVRNLPNIKTDTQHICKSAATSHNLYMYTLYTNTCHPTRTSRLPSLFREKDQD